MAHTIREKAKLLGRIRRIRGQMEDDVLTLDSVLNRHLIEQITTYQAKGRILLGSSEKGQLAGRKVVKYRHVVPEREETVHKVTTDEPRSAGN